MNINDILKNNRIIVTPNCVKKYLLLEIDKCNEIFNIKFMELKDLISSLTFTYKEDAIYYLMKKYNIKYEIAKIYLDNIKYVENKKYNIKKLDKLADIKNELNDNNLLIKDENINLFLKNKEIVVFGYDYISKYDLEVLNNIGAKIIDREYKNYDHDIYGFNNIDDEIEFVSNRILELVEKGIDINKIKMLNVTSEYLNPIRRIFSFYNIPINLTNDTSIFDTKIVSEFLKLLNNNDVEKSLYIISKKYDMNLKENSFIYNKLIDIINKYTFVNDINEIKDMLIYDFKHTKNYKEKYDNSVEIIDLKNNIIPDDNYVFLVGFNQGSIPVTYRNEDFITDEIKEGLMLETTLEKNKEERITVEKIIRNIKNLVISYKLKTPFEEYMKSPLVSEMNYNHIENFKFKNNYSNKMNYINLSKKLDKLIKYGEKDDELDLLYSNYDDIKYLNFNNKFKGIDKNELNEFLDNKLLLSYSSVDNYYRCSFRYYLSNILKLDKFETTFAINIGNIFHYVLSKCFEEEFDFEKEYNISIKDMSFDESDKFFLSKLKEELKFIIETIKKQNEFSTLKDGFYENKIFINKEGNIKLTFMGIIDKLLYKKENDKTYLVIIDYKTGNPHTNLNNTIYGIDMQLPVYLYLSNNYEKINNAEVIGFYLQKILNNEIVKIKGKTYEKQKEDNLKLQGYSINDTQLLSKFDFSYTDSEVIKSMKYSNDKFYAYSKVISKDEIDKLIEITKKNIDDAFTNILDAKFDINPKRIGKVNVGCEFCKFKDICYMKEEDIINLDEYKNLEFLK